MKNQLNFEFVSYALHTQLPVKQYSSTVGEEVNQSPQCTTNTPSPTRLSWGFFSSVSACCPVLLRVRAETCGLRPLRGQTGSAPDSLSSGHFSQYPRRPEMGRSPQGSLSMAKKINNLRVDESIGLFAALVGDQKSQPSGFGCGGLRKAGAGQKQPVRERSPIAVICGPN